MYIYIYIYIYMHTINNIIFLPAVCMCSNCSPCVNDITTTTIIIIIISSSSTIILSITFISSIIISTLASSLHVFQMLRKSDMRAGYCYLLAFSIIMIISCYYFVYIFSTLFDCLYCYYLCIL